MGILWPGPQVCSGRESQGQMKRSLFLHWSARLLLSFTFAFAALSKLSSIDSFVASVSDFRFPMVVASLVPAVELVLCAAILMPKSWRAAALQSGALAAIFLGFHF